MAKSYARKEFDQLFGRMNDRYHTEPVVDNDLMTVTLPFSRIDALERAVDLCNRHGLLCITDQGVDAAGFKSYTLMIEMPTVFDYAQDSHHSSAFDFVWALLGFTRDQARDGNEDYMILAVALVVKYEGSTPIVDRVAKTLARTVR